MNRFLEDLIQAWAHPPYSGEVRQQQFDGNQEALERLAAGGRRVDDLQDYSLDLLYVRPLQPNLFRLVFPRCLEVWQTRLVEPNRHCAFTENFHPALPKVMALDEIWEPRTRDLVLKFFRTSLLERLGRESSLYMKGLGDSWHPWTAGWVGFINSFATYSPEMGTLWTEWWAFPDPGTAISAIQYASALMYPDDSNPVFHGWTPAGGGGPPCLWSYESLGVEDRWLPENLAFLRETLNMGYLQERIQAAAALLQGSPAGNKAAQVQGDLPSRVDRVSGRIDKLLRRLAGPSGDGPLGWED
jgi:hypothetical protein